MQLEVWVGFDEFIGKTDAECVAIMCSEIVTKDHSLWNYNRVYQAYGLHVAEAVFDRLKADGMEAAALTYKDPGIDISLDESQAALLSWGSDPVIGGPSLALRAIGVNRQPHWQSLGFPTAPTESEVASGESVFCTLTFAIDEGASSSLGMAIELKILCRKWGLAQD